MATDYRQAIRNLYAPKDVDENEYAGLAARAEMYKQAPKTQYGNTRIQGNPYSINIAPIQQGVSDIIYNIQDKYNKRVLFGDQKGAIQSEVDLGNEEEKLRQYNLQKGKPIEPLDERSFSDRGTYEDAMASRYESDSELSRNIEASKKAIASLSGKLASQRGIAPRMETMRSDIESNRANQKGATEAERAILLSEMQNEQATTREGARDAAALERLRQENASRERVAKTQAGRSGTGENAALLREKRLQLQDEFGVSDFDGPIQDLQRKLNNPYQSFDGDEDAIENARKSLEEMRLRRQARLNVMRKSPAYKKDKDLQKLDEQDRLIEEEEAKLLGVKHPPPQGQQGASYIDQSGNINKQSFGLAVNDLLSKNKPKLKIDKANPAYKKLMTDAFNANLAAMQAGEPFDLESYINDYKPYK